MKRLVREWAAKAEADFASAGRELRARKSPNYDDACFHAQQCAEKYLKALLQQAGVPFARTHNLLALLDLLRPTDPAWELLRPALERLTAFAAAFRYPGEAADKALAQEALALCRAVRVRSRGQLGLRD